MSTLSHKIKLPYGGNVAYVWKDLARQVYGLSILNPKKYRRRAGNYSTFTSWQTLKQAIRDNIKNHFARESIKAAERAAIAALIPSILTTYQEGDIFSSSWGWEQTNVEFVQVVGKTNSRLMVRAISGTLKETQSMAGKLKPSKNAFIGPVFYLSIRPYGPSGNHSVRGSYVDNQSKIESASHWSKTPADQEHYCSWYA